MKETTKSNQTDIQQRRKLLKSAALGGGILGASQLGTQWVKPVVDSVMLPAHAATTDDTDKIPEADPLLRFSLVEVIPVGPFEVMTTPKIEDTLIASASGLLNNIIPAAHAGANGPESTMTREYYLGQISGDLYRFVYLSTLEEQRKGGVYGNTFVDGEISIGQSKTLPTLDCGYVGESIQVELFSAVKGGVAKVKLDGVNATLNEDPSATPPVASECDI